MKKLPVIHPFLFAIFPILFLFAHNIDKVRFSSIWGAAAITLCVTAFLFFGLKFTAKNDRKSGLIISTFLLLFFSYGHIARIIPHLSVGTLKISKYSFLLSIWAVSFILSTYLILKTHRDLYNLTSFFNIIAIALIAMSLVEIGSYEIRTRNVLKNLEHDSSVSFKDAKRNIKNKNRHSVTTSNLPDIYYIILDGYAREDTLKEIYHYDNSQFLNHLKAKGFYIAHKSRANYPQTYLSLASSLNFEYINYLSEKMGIDSKDRRPLGRMIQNNKVIHFLKDNGYIFVTFTSAYAATDRNPYADIYMHYKIDLNEFNNILINTTPFVILFGRDLQYKLHRKKILFVLDCMPEIAEIKAPTYVFAHIMAPHPPFVFDDKGTPIQPDRPFSTNDPNFQGTEAEYEENYIMQLNYINKKVQDMVDKILSKSNNPPIIILQSDHGPASIFEWKHPTQTGIKERFSIFNAFYLPDKGQGVLYETITPVNTFRIIFNLYFNTDYKLLDDRCYFASWSRPYELIDITDKLTTNQ